jgi:crotonobetainyl-CoA:carnitine CoA-transferase CaiB-like acyl-CoA transferase
LTAGTQPASVAIVAPQKILEPGGELNYVSVRVSDVRNGILAGLRVVDCGTYIAGPAATTVMSDFGADVIKIERPHGGDLWRMWWLTPGTARCDVNYSWLLTSRNKRSVALDLTRPDGREILVRLVKTADVFVTNYQATLLAKLRLEFQDLSALNPRLIYAHVTGYGDLGADADAPAFDALAYWARSGLMTSVTGADGSPAMPRPGIGDHPTAMSLFGAIMLGLYDRERTGHGSKVSTSLLASGVWSHACDLQAKICKATFPERSLGSNPLNALVHGYRSRDDKVFLLVQLDPDREFPRLCAGLGAAELATNPMFATNESRTEYAAELFAILQSQFESRDLAELGAIFREHDVKWSALPKIEDVVADAQVRDCGAFVDLTLAGGETIRTINSPVFVSGSEKRAPTPAPEIGAHTREVMRELGYGDDAIDAMVKSGIIVA